MMGTNKKIEKKRKKTKEDVINELRKEIINLKDLHDAKINEAHINMSIYEEKVNKMMHFHNSIMGCLDKIDEIRMVKIMEDISKK